MSTATALPIWTIGHSTLAIDDFLALVQKAAIETVVDVRTVPYSRFARQFDRLDLEAVLQRHGIDYRFEGLRLGGRPNDPSCYRAGVIPEHADRAAFLELVDYDAVKTKPWFVEGLEAVIELAASRRIALMCSEEDPLQCHRHHLIGSALHDRAIDVVHIRKSGRTEEAIFDREPAPVQASLFCLVEGQA